MACMHNTLIKSVVPANKNEIKNSFKIITWTILFIIFNFTSSLMFFIFVFNAFFVSFTFYKYIFMFCFKNNLYTTFISFLLSFENFYFVKSNPQPALIFICFLNPKNCAHICLYSRKLWSSLVISISMQ